MKLGSLVEIDSSLKIQKGSVDTEVLGLTDSTRLISKNLIFIKNRNYLSDFFQAHEKLPVDVGIIFDAKFFSLLNDEDKKRCEQLSFCLLVSTDINISMSILSKPFHDELFKNINDVVDGRQMGSCEIHSNVFIAQGVFIGEKVQIEENVKIHSGVVLMSGVFIGAGTEIFPNTVIYRNVKIGKNVRIHSNCSIGADGFGYNFKNGIHHKVWHMGSVIIGDNVEIGANSCVDGGTFAPTIIMDEVKLDNLVQVGHNVKLGKGVLLCGNVAIGGSTTIGDYTVFGGKAAASNGVKIGSQVQVAGKAGVTNNIEDKAIVGGFPARDIKDWNKGNALIRKLTQQDKKD